MMGFSSTKLNETGHRKVSLESHWLSLDWKWYGLSPNTGLDVLVHLNLVLICEIERVVVLVPPSPPSIIIIAMFVL